MAEDGLGRGIEDISHLFLSARQKRLEAEGHRGGGSAEPLVWPVVRVGSLAGNGAEPTWKMAWRLTPATTHLIHISVEGETTHIRWLGQAQQPPPDKRSSADLIDAADAAVIDLTQATEPVREQVILAAGLLVILARSDEADCVAAYDFIKEIPPTLREVTLGLDLVEGEGGRGEAASAFERISGAVEYFLSRPLVDWSSRYPTGGVAGGPAPPLLTSVPTAEVQGALCALAARARSAPRKERTSTATPTRQPGSSPHPSSPPPPAAARAVPRPLLVWSQPPPNLLADFLEHHPHLIQPDLVILERNLYRRVEGVVDLLGREAGGGAVAVLVSATMGGAPLLGMGLGYLRWCISEARLLRRLHPRLHIDETAPPRLVLAAPHFAPEVVEAVRAIRSPSVALLELQAYEIDGEKAVAVNRLL